MRVFKPIRRGLVGAVFIVAGLNHFRMPEMYRSIMPPYLPWHAQLVAVSGYAEILLGVLVLMPRFARVAGLGLMALLVAVFPANIHMALNSGQYLRIPIWLLWLRLPLQLVLIAWVYWCTQPISRRLP
jgi:uncharacterized membrane protein